MAITNEKVAAAELVGETQTALHSHAGGGGLPDLIVGKLAPALDQTIAAGYFGISSQSYEIVDTKFLEITNTAIMEIT